VDNVIEGGGGCGCGGGAVELASGGEAAGSLDANGVSIERVFILYFCEEWFAGGEPDEVKI
jgi:hypothetical protein